METTILYGNGINLLGGGKSWNQVLQDISDKPFLPSIQSNTLKYEYIILPQQETEDAFLITEDGYYLITEDDKFFMVDINTEENIKKNLSKKLKESSPSYFYKKLTELKVEHFITTNYELFLNDVFIKSGYQIKFSEKSKSCLYRHMILENRDKNVSVWNIHGDVNEPTSIMLGLSDYCKYVSEIDDYFRNKDKSQISCWVDLLLNTNVHIIGLGMAYDEIDLWNVLTTRMRIKRKEKDLCTNKIVYYAIKDSSFDLGKNQLLEAMGVDVVEVPFDCSGEAYNKAYEFIYSKLISCGLLEK